MNYHLNSRNWFFLGKKYAVAYQKMGLKIALVALYCLLFGNINLWAQQNGIPLPKSLPQQYQYPKTLQYRNMVYKDGIRTPMLYIEGDDLRHELTDPFIPLDSTLQLLLSFDQMGDESHNYSYTIIHCTHDWQASKLDPFDYIDGFLRDDITDYLYSFARTQKYVHYSLLFPNSNMRLTKSGNYLLKVYANDDPNDLILTRRFVVYENHLATRVILPPATNNQFFLKHQRLEFALLTDNFDVSNSIERLNVSVLQNGRWDNAAIGLKPTFIKDKELVYSPDMQTNFIAGSFFRAMNLRSVRNNGVGVAKIEETKQQVDMYLEPDNLELIRTKSLNAGFRGKYTIGLRESRYFKLLDADYVQTHFTLPMQKKMQDTLIYVFGALSDWDIRPEFEMKYNDKLGAYEAAIWLKQGFYHYQYALTTTDSLNHTVQKRNTEQSNRNYTTQNVYYIFTYYRSFDVFDYDRVIGFEFVQ